MRKQLRQLSGDTAIYGITTIVQRFLSFILTPFYTHFLNPAEFGKQAYLFVTIAFLLIFANVGMESAFFKFDAAADNEEKRRRVYWNAVLASWIGAAVIGGFIALFPGLFNTLALLHLEPSYHDIIRMVGGILFLDAASMVSLGLLRMRKKAAAFGGIKIAQVTVQLGCNILFLAFLGMKVEGIFLANLAGSLVQFGLILPLLFKRLPVRLDSDLMRQMFRFGVPTIASGTALITLQRIDQPILENLLGFEALGQYQANYRLGIAMMVFVMMFEFAWRPFFLQQAEQPNARQLFARVFTYFNLAAAVLFLAVSFFIVNIVAVPIPFREGTTLIAPQFWTGLTIVPIVLGAYIFSGWYANFIVGIYVEKRTGALPWITGLAAVAEAALCFALIPRLGIAGGAWATLAAYLVMAFTLYLYIRRRYPVPYEWGRVGIIGCLTVLLWSANILLLDFFDGSLQATLIRLGLLAAFPLLLLATGFFAPEERREIGRIFSLFRLRR